MDSDAKSGTSSHSARYLNPKISHNHRMHETASETYKSTAICPPYISHEVPEIRQQVTSDTIECQKFPEENPPTATLASCSPASTAGNLPASFPDLSSVGKKNPCDTLQLSETTLAVLHHAEAARQLPPTKTTPPKKIWQPRHKINSSKRGERGKSHKSKLHQNATLSPIQQHLLHIAPGISPQNPVAAPPAPLPSSSGARTIELTPEQIQLLGVNVKTLELDVNTLQLLPAGDHDPHECAVCGRRFARSAHALRHMTTHTGFRPYRCPWCDRKFSGKDTLRKHLRTMHGCAPDEVNGDLSHCLAEYPSGLELSEAEAIDLSVVLPETSNNKPESASIGVLPSASDTSDQAPDTNCAPLKSSLD